MLSVLGALSTPAAYATEREEATQPLPVVTVEVAPAVPEALLGGICHTGEVTVTQPPGFIIRRTGDLSSPLLVNYRQTQSRSDNPLVAQGRVELPAGDDAQPVDRLGAGAQRIFASGWGLGLQPGDDYQIGEPSGASFEGMAAAYADSVGKPCDIPPTQQKDINLRLGEELLPESDHPPDRTYQSVGGSTPPGVHLEQYDGPAGTAQELGDWTLIVRVCPYPSFGAQTSCGQVTYRFVIGGGDEQTTAVEETGPSITSTAESTTTTRLEVEAAVERGVGGGDSSLARQVTGGLVLAAGLGGLMAIALAAARRRRGSGEASDDNS